MDVIEIVTLETERQREREREREGQASVAAGHITCHVANVFTRTIGNRWVL